MAPIRVLVADDHVLFRRGVASLFDSEPDFELVGEAADGWQALESAHQLVPDVVLMDVSMPVMDGLEATRRIRAEVPSVKVVLLTVTEGGGRLLEALGCGASDYLAKRVEPKVLYETLRRVARTDAFIPPIAAARLLERRGMPSFRGTAPAVPASPDELTRREEEVLSLLAEGKTDDEVAAALGVSRQAVRDRVMGVLRKLRLDARRQPALR